jgi:hypothetical protein
VTKSISPEQLQQLLAGYVLYSLSADEAKLLAELLVVNPDLQRQVDQLQRALEIAYDSESVPPPPALRAAVLRSPLPPETAHGPGLVGMAAGRSAPWGRLWGMAAAALIAALGLSNLLLWRTLQLERASQGGGEALTIDLGSPDAPAPGQAQVVVNPATLSGSLTVENLPPLEPGSVYVLWTVVDPNAPLTLDDKNAILTTVFTVDEQGRASQPIDLPTVYRGDRSLVRAVAITKESAAAPQAHQSSPILIQRL